MTVSVRFTLTGDKQLEAAIGRVTLSEHPNLFRPVYRRWAITSTAISKEDYLSGPRPKRLGVVTHRLRSSISQSEFEPPGYIEFGTDVEYAAAHEFGRPEVNLPARPFIAPAAEEAFRDVPADILAAWEGQL
jgi:phage gpG-like protein